MPNLLCISIHFLGGEFHGRGDQGEPEWPPSPLRLFQAIVAVNARLGNKAEEALDWLSQQAPPYIFASHPVTNQPRGYTTYVPNNETDLVAKSWLKGGDKDISGNRSEKFIHPTLLENNGEFPAVHYLWPLKEDETIPSCTELIDAVRAVSQFGWGVDLVVANAVFLSEQETTTLIGERWLPSSTSGGQLLRVPVPGTLADLKKRYEAFLIRINLDSNVFKPVPPLSQFTIATYRRASEISRPPFAVFAIRKPNDSGFAAFSPTRRMLHFTGMMRCTAGQEDFAASLGWDANRVASFVMGHGETWGENIHRPVDGARLVFFPLPSIEWQGEAKGDCVGAVRRVLVTVKGHIANEEFNRIVRHLEGRELVDEKTGEVVAFLRRQSREDRAIDKYFATSTEWVSVTPVILPGYDDPGKLRRRLNTETLTPQEKANIVLKLETRIEVLLRKALQQAGYPEELAQHAELQWRGSGFMQGTDLATAYAVPDQHRRYRRLHVRVVWRNAKGDPLPLAGPHCFGGGRFTGLGLFVSTNGAKTISNDEL